MGQDKTLKGFGGWLILFILIIISWTVIPLFWISQSILSDGIDLNLGLLTTISLSIFGIYVLNLLFKKDKRTPEMILYFFIANFLSYLIWSISLIITNELPVSSLLTEDLVIYIGMIILWYLYAKESIRVKNTFVN